MRASVIHVETQGAYSGCECVGADSGTSLSFELQVVLVFAGQPSQPEATQARAGTSWVILGVK